MIIHTKRTLKNLGVSFLEEHANILNILKGEDKIKIILKRGVMNTNKIIKKFDLTPRAIRKCLLILEKKGEIKRIKSKIVRRKFGESDYWRLLKRKVLPPKVPKRNIFLYYRKEHYNKGYKNHYMFLPKKIVLNENELSAIGFFDAEGTKTNPKSIEVVNCETRLIKLFLKFLKHFKIKKEDLTYRIIFNKKILSKLNKKPKELESLKFWTNNITIPKDRIRKFNYTGLKKGKLRINYTKHGSLDIKYNGVLFRMFFFNLIKEMKKELKKEKDIISYLRGYLAGEAYVGKYDREIQIASKDISHLNFIKNLLEKINVKNSISKATSTSPPRIIITKLDYFLRLESIDIFKFHPKKKFNLLSKILNYKSLAQNIRLKLKKKLSNLIYQIN